MGDAAQAGRVTLTAEGWLRLDGLAASLTRFEAAGRLGLVAHNPSSPIANARSSRR